MTCEIENREMEKLGIVFEKLGTTKDPLHSWEVSERVMYVGNLVKNMNKAKEDLPGMLEFIRDRGILLRSHRKMAGEFKDPFGNSVERYEPIDEKSEALFVEKMNELIAKHKEDFEEDAIRKEKIVTLMGMKTILDIEPIDFEWCKGILDGNEIAFLREHNLVIKQEKKNK